MAQPVDQPPALAVRGLTVSFADHDEVVRVVSGVDLTVPRGALVGLLGESGSGKSVTARAIMGLTDDGISVTAESIMLGSVDVLRLAPERRRELRGQRIGLVLQDALSALNPVLSIGSQLGELFRVHQHLSRRQARAKALEMLALVGIPAPARRIDDYPHQFSGGMRQRILIAMGIALGPEMLIADEPTTALDVTVQAQILDLLDDLRRQLGMGVLLITHDLGVISEVADEVAVMYAGRIVESGSTSVVLDHPAHPYTGALLRSAPQVEQRGGVLQTIPGSPPVPSRVPAGCPFHPRCAMAIDRCRQERPMLRDVGTGRRAACHRSEELLDALTV